MKTYKVPSHIDPDKLFLVNRSELEGRLDPNFYKPKYTNLVYQISKKECLKLKQIVKFSNETWNQIDFFENQFPYIEIGEVNLETGYINSIKEIPISGAPSRAKMVARAYDILISTTRPTRGAVSYLKDIGKINIASTGFSIIRNIKKEIILREYLFYVLRLPILLEQMGQRSSGGNYPAITQEELGNIIIPLPPLEIQQQIVDFYQKAYQQKQQKETEAKALLESIDPYLFTELGIALPEKDNSLQNRIFTTMLSEISGGRFDAFAILNQHYKIEGGKFKNKKLKKIATLIKGQSITSDEVINGNYPVIAGGKTSPYNHGIFNFKGNIITVSASGAYSGFVWYHSTPIFASDCTAIRSKDESILTTMFLAEILKLKQQEIYNLQKGTGQPHVYSIDLEKLQIPLPPIEKQKEIAEYIQQLRSRSKHLQEEAKNILEQAKQEVEKMILGE